MEPAVSSPTSPPTGAKARPNVLGWVAVLALVILGGRFFIRDAVGFATHVNPKYFGGFLWPRRVPLLIHVAGGSVAILVAPFQFWSAHRSRRRQWEGVHRWTGRLYLLGVFVAGAAGFWLAGQLSSTPDSAFGLALGGLAAAWWLTTAMAYLAIRSGVTTQHKEWMIRSYVVTFAFATFRLMYDLPVLSGMADPARSAALAWIAWVAPLFATEMVLQGRRILAVRRAAR